MQLLLDALCLNGEKYIGIRSAVAALAAFGSLASCTSTTTATTTTTTSGQVDFARMLSGQSAMQGEQLAKTIAEAAAYPLGSEQNPVRAAGPSGQRAYLARLRCVDLKQPEFARRGSVGDSPYGNVMDVYEVRCPGSEPSERAIYMDMYHAGYSEEHAVDGYGITGARAE